MTAFAAIPDLQQTALPEHFARGLRALQERVLPSAYVAGVDGNFAVLSLGTMAVGIKNDGTSVSPATQEPAADAELPDTFAQESAELFARVPLTFPNAQPYGILTIPALSRRDGAPIERHHPGHAFTKILVESRGVDDVAFWSWDWTGMPQRRPEDMVAVVEWARRRVRQEG